MARKIPRKYFTLLLIALLGAALIFALWPHPLVVDLGEVARGPMTVSIEEEGRTRVREAYVVSTPVAGRLLRVTAEPGDPVVAGQSVVAVMLPANPEALDLRSLAQARAAVVAAEAALRLARADRSRAIADQELAQLELQRTRELREANLESQAALDRAIRQADTSKAALRIAEAAIDLRQAELANARARLIDFDPQSPTGTTAGAINIHAPISGRVLRLIQESEATLAAGTPVLELGNIAGDLEVIVELLSSDAVQVSPGNKVILQGWGGAEELRGEVERVEPWGFTKVSALGVEEQRVNTIIGFKDPPQAWSKLGHGFRVEAQIVIWEDADALLVPSSALFRDGSAWVVFAVSEGRADLRPVVIGRNNGLVAQVRQGLQAGDRVILYPAAELADGARVSQREIPFSRSGAR